MSTHCVDRRMFLEKLGIGSLGAMMASELAAQAGAAEQPKAELKWQPVSDRKIRFGIVGYGVCSMGAAFGLQNHPNVEVVAVSDLIPARCQALSKACRCEKTYESLEVLVKDPQDRGRLRGHRRPQSRPALYGCAEPRQARHDLRARHLRFRRRGRATRGGRAEDGPEVYDGRDEQLSR